MYSSKADRFDEILIKFKESGEQLADFLAKNTDLDPEIKKLLLIAENLKKTKMPMINSISRSKMKNRLISQINKEARFLKNIYLDKQFWVMLSCLAASIILIVSIASALIIKDNTDYPNGPIPFKIYQAPTFSELNNDGLPDIEHIIASANPMEAQKSVNSIITNQVTQTTSTSDPTKTSNITNQVTQKTSISDPTKTSNDNPNSSHNKNKDTKTPDKPINFVAYAGNLENNLEWSEPAGKSVAAYRVFRSFSEEGTYEFIGQTNEKSYSDQISQAELGTYYYKITALDNAGRESELTESTVANFVRIEESFVPAEDKHIIASTGELMFFVPAGSLSENSDIKINELISSPDISSDVIPVTAPYEFEPSGLSFDPTKPAQLTMPYNFDYQAGSENTKNIVEKGIKLKYYNEATTNWVDVPTTVDEIADTFTADVTHFTTYWSGAPTNPHGTSVDGSNYCMICHGYDDILHFQAQPKDKDVCYQCHGNVSKDDPPAGATGPNIQAEFYDCGDSPATYSRHSVPTVGMYCDSCHTPHKMTIEYPKQLRVNIGGTWYYDPNNNTYCFRCHNLSSTGYPNATASVSGVYPITGTYPGQAAYVASLHNTDSDVIWPSPSYAAGYCLNCHDSHGQANQYDILRSTFSRTNFSFCFTCHDGAPASTNIQALYNAAVDRAGHKTKSTGSNPTGFDAGDFKIPCYDCHNPHGSTTGNTKMISDERWNGVDPTTAVGNRTFCTGCHVFSNDGATTRTVEGIDSTNPNARLKLPAGQAAHASGSAQGCSGGVGGCHGDVHQPTGGGSSGGLNCATAGCHPEIVNPMINSTTTYHHYIDTSTATWPAFPGTRTCINTCHVDHDIFNSNKAANLKSSYTATNTATNNDKGLCLSCHTSTQNFKGGKSNPQGTTSTDAINQTNYEASAHYTKYMADRPTSSYSDATNFISECTKCHNDNMTKTKQTSAQKFSTHDASFNAISWASEENLCYQCHKAGGDYYGKASMDASATAIQSVFGKTYKHPVATYNGRHRPGTDDTLDSASRHAECADCHNPHEATAANPIKGVWGVTATYGGTTPWVAPTYGTTASATYEYQICFKCHSNYVTGFGSYNKAVQFNPYNAAQHAVTENNPYLDARGHNHTGSTTMYEPWATSHQNKCSDCHGSNTSSDPNGPHGSNLQYILKLTSTGNGGGSGTPLCVKCHKSSIYVTNDTGSAFPEHDKGAHQLADGCRCCHMNGNNIGWIHGEDYAYPATDSFGNSITPAGQKAKAFLRSSGMAGNDNLEATTFWNDAGTWTYRCYAKGCANNHSPRSDVTIQ